MSEIPSVSSAQMREVDRLTIEEAGISLLQMMENAGRCLAIQAREMLGGDPRGQRIRVLAGRGGNAGGGLAAARRLSNWGADVEVVLAFSRGELAEALAHQLATLEWMDVPVSEVPSSKRADLVLDAIFGYSLSGPPQGRPAELIRAANASGIRILALDLPSGLHPDSGEALEPVIRATATITLALPKAGLLELRAQPWIGALYVADISVPEKVYLRLGIEVGPIFADSDLVAIPPARS